ncbi:endonuclease/exonuclease/phosphatase family protein [Dyadobacter tibetensis]|uniref:endonuclease/exonuclease/phosphatase family protein n=1 Tax=Dyadobacter tibetensis TaxID=1211851 RepID=UPI00047206A7|nr:endonuclease/exonuclease/phosphatase family protein [Dyadobacter tibetensis]
MFALLQLNRFSQRLLLSFLPAIMLSFQARSQSVSEDNTLKIATFNVSMEAQNYALSKSVPLSAGILKAELASGDNQQIKNIAQIIQTVRPDIILLNEFDYISNPEDGINAFKRNYLNKAQNGKMPIDYPYYFVHTVNTGQPSPFDLDNDGKAGQFGADAWGYGLYPGQYGMVILSRFPLDQSRIRTFQHFKWKDMPGALRTTKADGSDWYSPEAWAQFPLSSKSHWDVPVIVGGKTIHLLASHPTPPSFDGAEDRNGKRNHDEIRFWNDYIHKDKSDYIYDDQGGKGGLPTHSRFVILGDQNASPDEGNAILSAIQNLLTDPLVLGQPAPQSEGAKLHSPTNKVSQYHTAVWRMRADYVLPSQFGFDLVDSGVFWPSPDSPHAALVATRTASSDHRMVWVKVKILP